MLLRLAKRNFNKLVIVGIAAVTTVIAIKPTLQPSIANPTSTASNLSGLQKSSKTGNTAIEPQFKFAANFNAGLAAVTIGNKLGYINKKGNVVIKPKFNWTEKFSAGLAAVRIGNKWGYISR